MHPPSCALAIVAAIGGPGITELGYGLLYPVAFNSLLLVLFALLYNNLTGHPYPKPRTQASGVQAGSVPLGEEHLSYTDDDVDRALEEFGEYVDVTRDDLLELMQRTEKHAIRRSMGDVSAADIMCHELHTCAPHDSLHQVRARVRRHRLHALAVVDPDSRALIGIVTQTDLLQHLEPHPSRFSLRRLSLRHEVRVSDVMSAPVVSVREDAQLPDLVYLLADRGMSCLPVVDPAQRLVGIITQSDLISGLYRSWMTRLGS